MIEHKSWKCSSNNIAVSLAEKLFLLYTNKTVYSNCSGACRPYVNKQQLAVWQRCTTDDSYFGAYFLQSSRAAQAAMTLF